MNAFFNDIGALTVGRIAGIRVRLHLTFLLYAGAEILSALVGGGPREIGRTLVCLALLFGMVVLHEFGHAIAARRVGGDADDILLWPLGGLATVNIPRHPRAHFLTAAAGPLVNLAVLLVSLAILWLAGQSVHVITPKLALPFFSVSGPWFVGYLLNINAVLFIFNLLPAFPMDGGQILRSLLWARLGYVPATRAAITLGIIAAILIGIEGVLLRDPFLIGLALFNYLACEQERVALLDPPFDGESPWTDRPHPRGRQEILTHAPTRVRIPWRRRIRNFFLRRRMTRETRERDRTETELDRLLEKISKEGMERLSWRERRFLRKASRRFRKP
ncbi:MAG: site-2 protease family protein [Planctomycetota bacterium]